MKTIQIKNKLNYILHVLFWFITFNFWNVILNPGVESTSVIQGFEVEWDFILLVNFLFLLYCSLPFVWLIRKKLLWLKLPVSILFLIPLGYVVLQGIMPDGNKEDVQAFVEYFVKNFLYVVVFHLTIVAAVYFNLKVLIVRFLNQSRFGTYLAYSAGLCLLSAILNIVLFDYLMDKLSP